MIRVLTSAVLLLLLAVSATGCCICPMQVRTSMGLHGSVLDARSGEPIEGVVVEETAWSGGRALRSDAEGRFDTPPTYERQWVHVLIAEHFPPMKTLRFHHPAYALRSVVCSHHPRDWPPGAPPPDRDRMDFGRVALAPLEESLEGAAPLPGHCFDEPEPEEPVRPLSAEPLLQPGPPAPGPVERWTRDVESFESP
ncbi:MAG: carboxypeptidase-like regulatory domain-containing protein [Deltaproteobacteria bacterium]|nr:carboxypeptidase-like regulatory domain-containing protein [Deltaproteobacteria bacterium]